VKLRGACTRDGKCARENRGKGLHRDEHVESAPPPSIKRVPSTFPQLRSLYRAFDPARCKERNTAGRCFGKLRQFRAAATRYDKGDFMYQATVDVVSIRIWLRDPVS